MRKNKKCHLTEKNSAIYLKTHFCGEKWNRFPRNKQPYFVLLELVCSLLDTAAEAERVRSSRRALAKTLWQPKASPAQPIFRHELFFEWLNRQRQKFDNYLLPMLDLSYLLTSWNRVNNLCGTIRGFPVGPNCRNLWHFLSYISWYLWH